MWIPYAWRLSEEKGRLTEGYIAEEGEQKKEEWRRVFRGSEASFLHSMHCGPPLTEKYGKQGSPLQREYAWRGEHCSGNNKVVKSLSLQAPRMAHLDLMAGVLSLLLYYSTSSLFSPAIYIPTLAICYFPLPLLPMCSFSLSLTFHLPFLFIFSEDIYCLSSFLYCSYIYC